MDRGKFIVFEGIDGSGKSTQLKFLAQYLEDRGIPCLVTREPTDSPFGKLLRDCLTGKEDSDERAIAALFAADRLDHVFNPNNGIERVLSEGTWVLCDRFYFSSFAYNGGIVPLEWVISLNEEVRKALKPDLTIYLDVPLETSMARILKRGQQERYETEERQRSIRQNFMDLFARFQAEEKIVTILSQPEKAQTQALIRAEVDKLF